MTELELPRRQKVLECDVTRLSRLRRMLRAQVHGSYGEHDRYKTKFDQKKSTVHVKIRALVRKIETSVIKLVLLPYGSFFYKFV